jgi:CheY-like chemotaxis protein
MTKFILYVEDHLYNMLLVKRIVLAEGHEFLAAENGEEGWHRYDLLKAAVELDRDDINATSRPMSNASRRAVDQYPGSSDDWRRPPPGEWLDR